MSVMKCAAVIAALVAFATGIAAAWFWLKSSQVDVKPMWPGGEGGLVEPGETDASQDGWIGGTLQAFTDSAKLNSTAARLTAISVFFSALASILGVL
jgi:hypothetical protein